MCWFYFSPWMCDLRNAALRANTFSFDRPMFAIVYGESNCGKSSLIETLMTSMFDYPRIVETPHFTRRNLRALQAAYQRFPVVFDDIHDDRFRRHAPEVIKDRAHTLCGVPVHRAVDERGRAELPARDREAVADDLDDHVAAGGRYHVDQAVEAVGNGDHQPDEHGAVPALSGGDQGAAG